MIKFKNIVNVPIRFFLGRSQGKSKYQKLFRTMHTVSLRGMNFGLGDEVAASGERAVLTTLAARTHKDVPVVFDVGANVGTYTQAILDAFAGKDVRVFAFEPARATFERLSARFKNVQNVSLLNFALGETSATAELFEHDSLSGLASLHQRRLTHHDLVLQPKERVAVYTLDAFCASSSIDRITLLKLDVEGHELSVLRGAVQMLMAGAIECIQFEFGGCNIDARTYFQDFFYLLEKQYTLFRIVSDGLIEIPSYSEAEEIFLTINYFAQLKQMR